VPAWLAPAVLLSALVAASISDLRTFRVPAWLSLATLLAGLAVSGVRGIAGIEAGFLGAVVGGLVLLPFVIKAGMGPADSLLLAGVGAWEGWRFALVAAFCASLAGAALALVAIALRRRALPYVPAITIGTLVAFVLLPFALSGQATA